MKMDYAKCVLNAMHTCTSFLTKEQYSNVLEVKHMDCACTRDILVLGIVLNKWYFIAL